MATPTTETPTRPATRATALLIAEAMPASWRQVVEDVAVVSVGTPSEDNDLVYLVSDPNDIEVAAGQRDRLTVTVGTAAGAGLAGLLFKLLTGGFGEQLLRTLFDHVLSLLGIG